MQRIRGGAVSGSLIATGIVQLLLIVSGIIVARGLGPEDRGYLALVILVGGITFLVASIGTPAAVTYYVARSPGQAGSIARTLLAPGVCQLLVGLVLQAALLFALLSHTALEAELAAVVSLLLLPAYLAFAYGLAILQGQSRFLAYNTFRTVPTVVYVAAVLGLFFVDRANLVAITASWTAANVLGGVLALGAALYRLPSRVEDEQAPTRSEMRRYGLKSLVSSASPLDQFRLDQAIVGLFLTPIALGLYVVAQAFTILPRLAAQSVGIVAFPRVAAQPDKAAARRLMWRYFLDGVALALLVAIGIFVFADVLVRLFFGDAFNSAEPIVRVLIVGSLFMAARRILTDGMNGLGHPGCGTLSEVVSWILLVPTLAVFLPRYGAVGVALALAVSWGVSLVVLVALALIVGHPTRLEAVRRVFVRPAFDGWMVRDSWRPRLAARLSPRTPPARRSGRPGTVGGAALASGAVLVALAFGLMVARAPQWIGIVAAVLLALAVFGLVGRGAIRDGVRAIRSGSAPDANEDEPPGSVPDPFKVARILYFVGLAFLGLITVRAVPKLTVSDAAFLASLLAACAVLVVRRRAVPVRLPALLLFGIGLFAFGGLVSSFNSYDSLRSVAIVVRLVYLTVLWFWLGTIVLEKRRHVMRAVELWVAGAAVCGAAGVIQILVGNVIPTAPSFEGVRATGFTWQPNDLGGITCVALVPAMMLASRSETSGLRRALSYCILFAVAAGLLVSGSVGSFLAAGTATLVWVALQQPTRRVFATFVALCIAVSAAVGVQTLRGASTPLERLAQVTSSREEGGTGSIGARIQTYEVVETSIRRDPFVGVGLDLESATKPFPVFSYEYDVHNVVLATWYKAGLFGLAGLLIAFLAIFRSGWLTALRTTSSDETMLAVSLIAAMVAFVVLALGSPILYVRYGWVSGALLLALGTIRYGPLSARERRNRAPVSRPIATLT